MAKSANNALVPQFRCKFFGISHFWLLLLILKTTFLQLENP